MTEITQQELVHLAGVACEGAFTDDQLQSALEVMTGERVDRGVVARHRLELERRAVFYALPRALWVGGRHTSALFVDVVAALGSEFGLGARDV